MDPNSWLDVILLDNPVRRWLAAAAFFFVALAVVWIVLHLARGRARKASRKTSTVVDDIVVEVLSRTKIGLLMFVAAWAALRFVQLPDGTRSLVRQVAIVALFAQVGVWVDAGLRGWLSQVRKTKENEGEDITWIAGLTWAGQAVVWVVVVLLGLENLGVNVTGLATTLGIGGVAVALAVQNVLGDLFAAVSIYADKPFILGDFLTVAEQAGSVEKIGLKTTRLRSLSGEQLVFSNSDLLNSRIHNFGRMRERRVVFPIGVVYGTPVERLRRIPILIREAIEQHDNTRFDRAHFKAFGDFALTVETVYYMLVPDYNAYMDTQQAVNLEIMTRFADEGIEFAYPTQTILLEGAWVGTTEAHAT